MGDITQLAIPAWELAFRSAVIYLVLMLGIRIFGKREIGQFTVFDLLMLLLITNALQPAMTGPDNSLFGGFIIIIVTLLLLNWLVSWLRQRVPLVRIVTCYLATLKYSSCARASHISPKEGSQSEMLRGPVSRNDLSHLRLIQFLRANLLNWLLLLVPISWVIDLLGLSPIWLFIASALAIVPLAGLIGEATEELAHWVGPGLGGILNATLGNATELIIGLFALNAGLYQVVKASITGSIIGNILLVLGVAMLMGGWGRDRQTFSRVHAGASSSMLFLAVVALVMPAVLDLVVFGTLEYRAPIVDLLSLLVAIVLMATYLGSLVFSLRTHRELMTSVPEERRRPRLSLPESLLFLAVATAAVAVESELLVGTIAETTAALGLTQFFIGVVVVAVVGNAAEHSAAVMMAMRNRMELAVNIATGSSTQVALFVAPVLVFASFIIGQPMSLIFNALEIVGIGLSVIALAFVVYDGESNWFEGLQLIAVYLVLALVFFFLPTV